MAAPDKTRLVLHGPDGEGTWKHAYTTDGSAVVGAFEGRLDEVLHLVGAFGAAAVDLPHPRRIPR